MKSLLWIILFVVAAMALLQVLDELAPIGGALSWGRLLYLIGGAIIFLVYTRRRKSKGPLAIKDDRARDESGASASPEDDDLGVERLRERVRSRKAELRSRNRRT